MRSVATTRMSSRGQVVIPEAIRKDLGIAEGAEFVVVGRGDAVVLQRIAFPKTEDFQELLREARREAQAAGLKRGAVKEAVAAVRRRSAKS